MSLPVPEKVQDLSPEEELADLKYRLEITNNMPRRRRSSPDELALVKRIAERAIELSGELVRKLEAKEGKDA